MIVYYLDLADTFISIMLGLLGLKEQWAIYTSEHLYIYIALHFCPKYRCMFIRLYFYFTYSAHMYLLTAYFENCHRCEINWRIRLLEITAWMLHHLIKISLKVKVYVYNFYILQFANVMQRFCEPKPPPCIVTVFNIFDGWQSYFILRVCNVPL